MTRRRALIATGAATLLLLAAMAPAEGRMMDGGHGIIAFELSGGESGAAEIMADWGEDGRAAARESLWIDFPFLVAYAAFLALAAAAVRDAARARGWERLARLGGIAIWLGPAAAALDAAENVCLLLTLDGGAASLPLLATVFASVKLALLAAALAYLACGLVMRLRVRERPSPAG